MLVAGVIIYKNKAHVPVNAQMEAGPYLAIAPVYTTELETSALTKALQEAYDKGNPRIPNVNYKDYQKSDPILKAAGVKSWNQLAKTGASYGIQWMENEVTLWMSQLDTKGRFVQDSSKTQQFPVDVSIRQIVDVILADWRSRMSNAST